MAKELNVEINIADYLDHETLKRIATDMFKSNISRLMYSECDTKRILSNSAYDIVCDILEKRHGINLESDLEKKCLDIINDKTSVKYELFRDDHDYYSGKKGIGLVLLEKIVTEKLQDKLEKVAENVIKNIKLDTRKFEKLVAEKVAEKVAAKLNK